MKIWYIVIGIVVLILVVWAVSYFGKKKKDKTELAQSQNIMLKFPAKRGDSGEHIGVIQRWINQRLNPPLAQLEVDNKWGSLTDTALNYITGESMVTYSQYSEMV